MLMIVLFIILIVAIIGFVARKSFPIEKEAVVKKSYFIPKKDMSIEIAQEFHSSVEEKRANTYAERAEETPLAQQLENIEESETQLINNLFNELKKQLDEVQTNLEQTKSQVELLELLNFIDNECGLLEHGM